MTEPHGRRASDVELQNLADDVREIKTLLVEKTIPRIENLEEWRITLAAIELEREKNRARERENVIGKRQFWLGITGLAIAMIGSAAALAGVVIANT